MSMAFWRGAGDVLYVPTIANTAAPTATEIAAGTSLSMGITAVRGFTATVNRIGVPILGYDTDVQVNGPASFVDSGFDLVEDDGVGSNTDDVARRTAITTLAKGTAGYFVFSRFKKKAAMIAAVKVDVFAGYIAASNKQWTMDANVARRAVDVILTADPKQDVAIAA
jgi:hypothetical protein